MKKDELLNDIRKSFWNKKRVLCTGGHGFLGKRVVEKIQDAGGDVYAPVHHMLDVRNVGAVDSAIMNFGAQIVIHMAANVAGIGGNMKTPADIFYDNALMGMSVIKACQMNQAWGLEKLVITGTVCSYPSEASIPFVEEDFWNGYPEATNAAYGISKKMLLSMAQAYRQQYGLNTAYLILANLYGPGADDSETRAHVIPAIIKKIYAAKLAGDSAVVLWGDGTPTRDFLYVDDAATAVVLAAQNYNSVQPVNVGTNIAISIRAIAECVAHIIGYGGDLVFDNNMPNGQALRRISTARMNKELSFLPTVFITDGLMNTVNAYIDRFGREVLPL